MKIGDLVRPKKDHFSVSEEDWIGMIVDFNVHVDHYGEPQERYAVVCWSPDFPNEEEYPSGLEVINEGR
jgi:hypothetical protein